MKRHAVVVSGMGIVSSIGSTLKEFESKLFAGNSGISAIGLDLDTRLSDSFPVPYAGSVNRQSLTSEKELSSQSESCLFSVAATVEAIKSLPDSSEVDAIVYGSADGIAFDDVYRFLKNPKFPVEDLPKSEDPLTAIQRYLYEVKNIKVADDRLICVNSACASGNQAIGEAMQMIRTGEWQRVLVGGVDTRCNPANLLNFNMLGALCTEDIAPEKASRPFSKDRAGFVRGEGAATLLLESVAACRGRGGDYNAMISGYAMTSDAYRLTDGREDGLCIIRAMQEAIKDADLIPDEISAVSAHGTSTPLNDRLETMAIKKVFGEKAYQTPVTSLKSQIGHSTVAAGAIEAVASVIMLKHAKLAPTVNLHQADPDCDLDYVPNRSRDQKLRHILSNNFGFGGINTCLVISHASEHTN